MPGAALGPLSVAKPTVIGKAGGARCVWPPVHDARCGVGIHGVGSTLVGNQGGVEATSAFTFGRWEGARSHEAWGRPRLGVG